MLMRSKSDRAATAVAQVEALEGEGANGARGVTMDAARQIRS